MSDREIEGLRNFVEADMAARQRRIEAYQAAMRHYRGGTLPRRSRRLRLRRAWRRWQQDKRARLARWIWDED